MLKKEKKEWKDDLLFYFLGILCCLLILLFFSFRRYQYDKKVLENYIFVYQNNERDCKVVGTTNYKVSVSRKYELLNGIKGSVWELKKKNSKKTYTLTTDKDGYSCMIGLPKGEYSIKEVKVPKERTKYEKEINFSLNQKNNVKDIKIHDKYEKIVVVALLTDELGNPIPDREFELYHDTTKVKSTKTNEKGQLGFINIPREEGIYLLDKKTNKKYTVKLEDTLNVYRFFIKESRLHE